ncbi:MAG: tRNA (adenosine(37)-N6)-threonylcarbamoyltransferase complex ATPase subunit type 1 TsaE [Candidatus Wolfebacteria bacterium]|nr:tRNA (adenosine(37)-N6)-threonylcarbamoyltransferase complex ATPase subunit type 1 TsaE [Candidatus Wolfebacteria bacterium]MDP2704434.1 tRNA (adenosine(37)-N6)-threonylcarbamoyltransferase complex ATPase subunit type 1 TsaE [bacterium]
MEFKSFSPQETKRFAGEFAESVLRKAKGYGGGAFAVVLSGELGAGKTTFVQGFTRGLGLRKKIQSPTFVFVRRYEISVGRFVDFYHIDAYRVRSKKDLVGLGLKEVFADSGNLVLVEWAENVRGLLPKDAVWVRMRHGEHENERYISI